MIDAHCHPWDLLLKYAAAEEERRKTGTAAAASSWNLEQFEYHEGLALKAVSEAAPPLFCCFALHPQLSTEKDFSFSDGLKLLYDLAAEKRLDAVGETGFDLYSETYKNAEKIQDELFASHLELAQKYNLPLILHVRRAMHKIFPLAKELKKLPAVVFHSWSGTRGEGEALLSRGINAFFSFGAAVVNNHKEAMISAAFFPSARLLFESDAPYQPLRGNSFSSWRDLSTICQCIADLRKEASSSCFLPEELKEAVTANFFQIFSVT